jgi:hypothetical protein
VLANHGREKKKKYLEACCLGQRRHFSPFMISTDGLLSKEAKTLLKKVSALLARKWEKPYSEVCGYINARMNIAVYRASHFLCLRGSRIPTGNMSNHLPQWEDKAVLGSFRYKPAHILPYLPFTHPSLQPTPRHSLFFHVQSDMK